MRSLLITALILSISLTGIVFSIGKLSAERAVFRQEQGMGLVIPASIAKIAAFEYKGIAADLVFFRTMMYFGAKIMKNEDFSEKEWDWIYQNMLVATDLDPYFYDPYLFGGTNLAWGAHRIQDSNSLFEKALQYRTWDWTIPFNIGFNYFYFLQDNDKAFQYLTEATKRPGGSVGIVPTLAARLAYKGKKTETAVIFLEEILQKTEDRAMIYIYERRLNALKKILYLEKASEFYKKKTGRYPKNISQLVAAEVVKEIPRDPYGGEFYIESDGTIRTTSNLQMKH